MNHDNILYIMTDITSSRGKLDIVDDEINTHNKDMIEQWKFYKDTRTCKNGRKSYNGGIYEVSNYGRVKKNGEIINPYCRPSGYYCICGGIPLHVIVVELFIGNIPNGYVIDHIDHNKQNNNVNNLRICTQKDNCLNKTNNGKQSNEWIKKRTESRRNTIIKIGGPNKNRHREYNEDGTYNYVDN